MEVWIAVKWDAEDAEVLSVHGDEGGAIAFVEAHNAADASTWVRCRTPCMSKWAHEWGTTSGNYGVYIRRYNIM